MDPHLAFGNNIPGVGPVDAVSYQQTVHMQEYKYAEHIKKLDERWARMKDEFEKMSKGMYISLILTDSEKLRNHQLPLARVKKIMKSDEDVKVPHTFYRIDDQCRSTRPFREGLRNVYNRADVQSVVPYRRE